MIQSQSTSWGVVGGVHGRPGWQFHCKCISTTPIPAPISICPLPAIPPAPPLILNVQKYLLYEIVVTVTADLYKLISN